MGFTPEEGEGGTPISVRISFHHGFSVPVSVRLLMGNTVIPTTVREIKDAASYGCWQLDIVAPPFDSIQLTSNKVLMSVQTLSEDHAVVETLPFGEFSYWAPGL